MAGLLAIAIWGSVGHMADPFVARGVILGAFVAMQVRRWQCRRLDSRTILLSGLAGAILVGLARRFLSGAMPSAFWLEEVGEILVAAFLASLLMQVSFHFLTLRRGWM